MKMFKKKIINITIIFLLIACACFMSISIYRINNVFVNQDKINDNILQKQLDAYDNTINKLITEESVISQNNGETSPELEGVDLNNFYSVLNHSLDYHDNATASKVSIKNGKAYIAADASIPVVGSMSLDIENTINYTKVKNSEDKQLVNIETYGEVPTVIEQFFKNQLYMTQYVYEPNYYVFKTKNKVWANSYNGNFKTMNSSTYYDKYYIDLNKLLYSINEDTVKEIVSFVPAPNKNSNIQAKILINTDTDVANNTAKASATSEYSQQINRLIDTDAPCTFSYGEITFNFTSDCKFHSVLVKVKLSVSAEIKGTIGLDLDVDLEFKSTFDYNKDYTINVQV